MTKYCDLFTALAAPFAASEIKTKPQGGRQLRFVTARTTMNRLDAICGPENWWDDYTPLEKSVICRLSIRLPDGQVVTKADAGGHAGMADAGDDEKSGFSDAFKRAAVKFGVGRYLYNDGVANLESSPAADHVADASNVIATPEPPRAGAEDAQGRGGRMVYGASGAKPRPQRPKTGQDLYYFCVDNADSKLREWVEYTHVEQGYPPRILDWAEADVTRAWPGIREHCLVMKARAKMSA